MGSPVLPYVDDHPRKHHYQDFLPSRLALIKRGLANSYRFRCQYSGKPAKTSYSIQTAKANLSDLEDFARELMALLFKLCLNYERHQNQIARQKHIALKADPNEDPLLSAGPLPASVPNFMVSNHVYPGSTLPPHRYPGLSIL